ncbi:MAG: glycosyl hydrolase family 28-related protein [Muribaculaceae bacterium]
MRNLATIVMVVFAAFAVNAGNAGSETVLVNKCGAKGDGVKIDTKAINKAISKAPKGATVIVPPGKYLTGTIVLKSDITFEIAEGAELIGVDDIDAYESYVPTRDMSRYDTGEGTRNSNMASDSRWTKALILGVGLNNVRITGSGTINGKHVSDSLGEEGMRGPHGLILAECSNVSVENVNITCASNYAVLGYELVDCTFSGMTITEGWDGIHIRGCENVAISNCDISTGDDAIAGGYWKNMKIDGCRLNSSCNGIRMIEPSTDVEIGNCSIKGPGRFPHRTSGAAKRTGTIYGIVLEPGAWGDAPGHTENVYIHDVAIDNLLSPIVYSMGEDNTCSGLTIENVVATHITYNTTPLNRQDCVRMWDNITIKNMVVKKGE